MTKLFGCAPQRCVSNNVRRTPTRPALVMPDLFASAGGTHRAETVTGCPRRIVREEGDGTQAYQVIKVAKRAETRGVTISVAPSRFRRQMDEDFRFWMPRDGPLRSRDAGRSPGGYAEPKSHYVVGICVSVRSGPSCSGDLASAMMAGTPPTSRGLHARIESFESARPPSSPAAF